MKHLLFLIDVDNTLLDNDGIKDHIKDALTKVLGKKETEHFWKHHDGFRTRQKLVDFPAIIREYCAEKHADTCDLTLHNIFHSIDFKHCIYPKAQNAIKHLKKLGKVYLFTEGDQEFQKLKVKKSGLIKLVDGLLLYEHKLAHLNETLKQFPKHKVVIIEDKPSILKKIKEKQAKVTTIRVRQGHYVTDDTTKFEPDLTFNSISELINLSTSQLQTPTLPLD